MLFMGVHPYGAMSQAVGAFNFSTIPNFKRSQVVAPSQNLCLGDGMPKSDGFWSSSRWATSCMNPASATKSYEGVDIRRHQGNGLAVFNDGHSEPRREAQINPPVDPVAGTAAGLVNSQS